ncbi:putative U-box domain-containing protein 50 isoform X2 [Vicia villosa]|uniref:putative U-box domain-containing protein 50 isoform X2 n=1 Tax=Vicia villosa TaxID=3911 RepID=UPI00273B19C8|nr:putative U-box domain-containing protein 50 isoform X2 [Vicia villosa]
MRKRESRSSFPSILLFVARKSKGAISGLFYVHQHKPSSCELFIICGGKQVFLRGNNDEKIMEDDSGVMVAKMKDKVTFKDWLDKMFSDKTSDYSQNRLSASPSSINLVQNQWEFYLQDIENYYQELLSSSNLEEGIYVQENDDLHVGTKIEPLVTELNNSNKNTAEKIEILRKTIELKRKETKENIERRTKAEWAISLCNSRAEELEGRIRQEVSTKENLNKELHIEKEQREEMRTEIIERKQRMNSLIELQSELSNKLQISTISRSRAETHVERAVRERTDMVREIEELRKQRDVLNRRIEFCKQKDAIGMAARLSDNGGNGTSSGMREYSEEELRLATDNFSERLRLKCGREWTNVYRGRFNHSTVAIKIMSSFASLSRKDFQSKVRFLGDIRHPHLVAVVGFCCEPKCVVFEYMGNGSLQDMLFTKRRNRGLRWHDRIRIATEVCSGLGFLNSSQQRSVTHCHLSPGHVLLDRNLVAKITGFGLQECNDDNIECNVESDLHVEGVLLMQLLTGRNWAEPIEELMTMNMDRETLVNILDDMAGQWPLDLAKELLNLAMICMSMKSKPSPNLSIAKVIEELNQIRRKGDEIVAKEDRKITIGGCVDREGSSDVPSVFLCPIQQEVMKNPHVAADGFSYELEAIEQWLHSGHDTSPMTNLRLKHTSLTPNYTLRSFLEEWQSNKSAKIEN